MNDSNTIQQLSAAAPRPVVSAVQKASDKSGVDFSYLLTQAKVESSFNPMAEAKTSSATGLYQFIDSTWMNMVDRYGEQYGLHTNGKTRDEVLAMRKDPEAASFMAAAFASENETFLNNQWGGDVGATELYLAHFMGASGASSFLNALDDNPLQTAADLYPAAARANQGVFYDRVSGEARTLAQVYDFFDQKFQDVAPPPRSVAVSEPRPQHNALYSASTQISNHSFMLETQAQRDSNAGSTLNNGFFNLLIKPLDVALLLDDNAHL